MSLRYALLALLEHEPMTGYGMAKTFDTSVGYFWSARHQQIYRELRELSERGWVLYRDKPQLDKPDLKIYSITAAGHDALVAWVDEPLAAKPNKEPMLVKLLAAPAVARSSLLAEIDRQIARAEAELTVYREIESRHYDPPPDFSGAPDRQALLYLSLTRGISGAQSYRDWLSRTRQLLDDD